MYNGLLWITAHSDGDKMESFKSLSTPCNINEYCKKRIEYSRKMKSVFNNEIKKAWQDKKAGLITMNKYKEIKKDYLKKIDNLCVCGDCYADTMTKQYESLRKHLEENYKLLTNRILEFSELPTFSPVDTAYFRLESFGDVANTTQLINYLNICEKNEFTHFAIWSKNIDIFRTVFDDMKYKKPKNLNIVISSPFKNKVASYTDWFIDSIFTVWTGKQIAIDNGYTINCMKKCKECIMKKGRLCCYNYNRQGNTNLPINYVNELLKSKLGKEGGYND